ncbi:MAG: hypothetical protein ACRD9S_22295 [Pyrinomonadaceae bacterium]
MKLQVVAGGVLMLLLTANSQGKAWRQIVPLKSTRADVERLLGKPNGLGRYQFDDERAYIYYTKRPCDRADDCACLVPQDTVLEIFVTPEVEMKFSKLKIDKGKFTRTRSTHLLTVISYSNDDEGIIYAVDDDEVTDITYVPSKTDCQELIKKRASNNPKIQKAHRSAPMHRTQPIALRWSKSGSAGGPLRSVPCLKLQRGALWGTH